jgi:hypothetical protein
MGNNKADNYSGLMEHILLSDQKLGCIMSLKILFVHYHQDIFLENCGSLNSEHGECFHHDISAMENPHQGQWSSPVLADCC